MSATATIERRTTSFLVIIFSDQRRYTTPPPPPSSVNQEVPRQVTLERVSPEFGLLAWRAFFNNQFAVNVKKKHYCNNCIDTQKANARNQAKFNGRKSSVKIDERQACWTQQRDKNNIRRKKRAESNQHDYQLCDHGPCNTEECEITHITVTRKRLLILIVGLFFFFF